MGREVRRVPADWQHPEKNDGSSDYQPMFDKSFDEAAREWKEGFLAWEGGVDVALNQPRDDTCEYWEYDGGPPDRDYYMPYWPEEERTHLQMYECTSEGTPISPVTETPEELAQWLVDNNVSAFARETASYEAWLRVVRGGFAPSLIASANGTESGVQALTEK